MSCKSLTDLGRDLVFFFEAFLRSQRGLSPHTIRSYRDTLVLLLQFSARETGRGVERLAICDLSEERIVRFLRSLEVDRKNTVATRNARLGSIHVLARFLAGRHPEQLGALQRVIGLPFKHGTRDARSSTWSAPRWMRFSRESVSWAKAEV
jgi:integrase/recombinase XerD